MIRAKTLHNSIAQTSEIARIGPNALIQTARALHEEMEPEVVEHILRRGGESKILQEQPAKMVSEGRFASLVSACCDVAGLGPSRLVLERSGRYTAQYLLENRIPRFFQTLLRWLPPRPGLALLLFAISQNAWTFTGSGHFVYSMKRQPELSVLCNVYPGAAACGFYGGTFKHLIHTLIDPKAQVETTISKQANYQTLCRYVVTFGRDLD